MKKNIMGLAVAGVLAAIAFNASAEEAYEGSWYAVPGVSIVHPDSDLETDNTGGGGFLRLGKELSEHWDVQLGGGYTRTNNDLDGVSGKYKQTLLGVDALYMFSREKFRPFLLAGVGAARNNVDYNIPGLDGKNTSLMANVGAGFQYLITDTFGLQADIREIWSRADLDQAPLGSGKETIPSSILALSSALAHLSQQWQLQSLCLSRLQNQLKWLSQHLRQ